MGMKLTNKYGYPTWLEAVLGWAFGKYDKGAADYSISQLAQPPYLEKLKRENELEMDISSIIDIIIGKAVHALFEAGFMSLGIKSVRFEERITEAFEVDGKVSKVTGQYDIYDVDTSILWDTKVVKVAAARFGPKDDYIAQLNGYAELMERRGLPVAGLRNLYLIKDWSPRDAAFARTKGEQYPTAPIVVVDIPLWDSEKRQDWIASRIRAHRQVAPAPCSTEERWEKPAVFAVKKKADSRRAESGGLFDNEAGAKEMAERIGGVVEVRPGERMRCMYWCAAASVCPSFKEAA